ncbi:hypothetical protein WJX84_008176 [Apatococcus fuscideae]|uniref:Tyrosine specific protein phosphatases domain-containing protein n=1 Tax=Apatococcus fuscideae TaxID=2026836 RepID=A0AAW1T2J8_9CHLO
MYSCKPCGGELVVTVSNTIAVASSALNNKQRLRAASFGSRCSQAAEGTRRVYNLVVAAGSLRTALQQASPHRPTQQPDMPEQQPQQHSRAAWVACVWNEANALRLQHGLSLKDFHISLQAPRNQPEPHSLACLMDDSPWPTDEGHLVMMCRAAYQAGLEVPWVRFATQLCRHYPDKAQGWCILGDAAAHSARCKLAMAAYHNCWGRSHDAKVRKYCLQGMAKASTHTAWGPIFTEAELNEMPQPLRSPLFACAWDAALGNHAAASPILPATAMFVPSGLRLPRFLSWILPFRLAAGATPKSATEIAALKSMGIQHVYTLTEEEPLPASFFGPGGPQHTFSPVPNGQAPTFTQVDLFLEAVAAPGACVLVHCGGGKGRAGTFAACCLAMLGSSPPPDLTAQHPLLSAQEAIRVVRHLRPGSIETQQQEAFVQAWVKHRWQLRPSEPLAEPQGIPLEIQGRLSLAETRLMMLVGLPGSGKSWFAQALAKRRRIVIISQDDSRSRSACESQLGASIKTADLTVLDRCNASRADRKIWLDIAGGPETTLCVVFCYGRELCLQRGDRRLNHPTLRPGRMTNAMDQMTRMFEPPSLQEGFGAVANVRCHAAAFGLAVQLGGPLPLHKFPRTEHLVNLGAATSDDLIHPSPAGEVLQGDLVVEEKVDGACMGISLASDTSILVQNRNRFVTSKTHAQFARLGGWVEARREQLLQLLHRDEQFPERFMLFGEWVAATHAIHYTALPDLFLAFDLYDRLEDAFVSRPVLSDLVKDTDIKQVPLMVGNPMGMSIAALCQLTHEQSAYHDGPVEGLYVRLQGGGHTLQRYKIVRADFAPGNSEWKKQTIMNRLQEA